MVEVVAVVVAEVAVAVATVKYETFYQKLIRG